MQKQVEKDHYLFSKYMHKQRWSSVWHQLDEILQLSPESVLEIGAGLGIFKANAAAIGIKVETVDLDPELQPDHVASATKLPFADQSYDVVCAFQMLEHLPFDESLKAFAEMGRVAKKYIVISLPDAKTVYTWKIQLPKLGFFYFHIPKPIIKAKTHIFDGEHYWEINKKGYAISKVTTSFIDCLSEFEIIKKYRVVDNPYHYFFLFKRKEII